MNIAFPVMLDVSLPTDEAAVAAFERYCGHKLPPLYRRFLLEVNGGVPEKRRYPVEGSYDISLLTAFLELSDTESGTTLRSVYDTYMYHFAPGLIPIAYEGTGNYICLDLRDGGEQVKYWDRRHFWNTGEWRESDLFHVAGSFEEFLSSLRSDEEVDAA